MRCVDLTDKVFGKLRVLRREGKDKFGNALWLCECECKETLVVKSGYLTKGITTSCEKCRNPIRGKIKDLTGQTFGRLTVVAFDHLSANGQAYWRCRCTCGNDKIISAAQLKWTKTSSCGCYRKEYMSKRQKTHGLGNTRLYRIWSKMKSRCYYKKHDYYDYYGGKGVSVCEEWMDFINFYTWAINNGYDDSLTIDRINNDGNYEPSNCRWVDKITQSNNKSSNVMIEYMGKTQSLADWCRELGLDYYLINNRHHMYPNKSPEELFKPKNSYLDMIEHNGEVKHFNEWCRVFGVNANTARDRRRNHPEYTFEQIFKPVVK